MGLLTGASGIFNKTRKKKDVISQAAIASMMEKASDGKEFMASMDEYLKNKNKENVSIEETIRAQQNRLDVSDSYLESLPIEKSISGTKAFGSMIGAAALVLIEQAGSAYIDAEVMKKRDITKQARFNNVKSATGKALGLGGAIFGGAIAGSVVPGLGTAIGGIIGGLTYIGSQAIGEIGSRDKEKWQTNEANKEALVNSITLGNIASKGNRNDRR